MKILLISQSFYPKKSPRSYRTTELAKEFHRQGHDVTILSNIDLSAIKKNEYLSKLNFIQLDNSNIDEKPELPGNKILKFFKLLKKRILDQFFYYPQILQVNEVFRSLNKLDGYDILISIASPHTIHWGVDKTFKKGYKPAKLWIADCGDPFMFAENLQYKRPFYFSFFEKSFCKNTDYITVPAKQAIEGYYPEFRHKIKIIPQGFNFNEIKIDQSKKTNKDIIEFAYAGSMNIKRRNPTELIDYLISKNINFRFYLFSKDYKLIKSYNKKYPDKIILSDYVERIELLFFLSKLDFVVNFQNLGENQIPSKLIDYAIIKKPILNIKFNNLNTVLVDEFISGNYENALLVENIDQYRIENVASNFLNLYTNLNEEGKH